MRLQRGGGRIAPIHSPSSTRKQRVAVTTLWLLYHRESPNTCFTRIWVSLGARLDSKGFALWTVQPIARCYTDWDIPVVIVYDSMISLYNTNDFSVILTLSVTLMFIGPCNIVIVIVIQQHSRKLLMMGILMSETCWAHKKWNKTASDTKLVFHSSTNTRYVPKSNNA